MRVVDWDHQKKEANMFFVTFNNYPYNTEFGPDYTELLGPFATRPEAEACVKQIDDIHPDMEAFVIEPQSPAERIASLKEDHGCDEDDEEQDDEDLDDGDEEEDEEVEPLV